MSVLYYEDWTPNTYCPTGFKQVEKDLVPAKLFKGPSQLHNFGNAASPYLAVYFSLERRQDDNYENSVKDLTVEPSQPLVIGQPSQQVEALPVINAPSTQISSPSQKKVQKSSPGVNEITQTTQALTFETPHLVQQRLLAPAQQIPPALEKSVSEMALKKDGDSVSGNVRCFCDDAYVVQSMFVEFRVTWI